MTTWPVRLLTLIFGAAAFENCALAWVSDHRRHHKHVDHDEDPYDISKGFFYAHIGWLLFRLKPKPPVTNVKDLEADPLVMWQHRYVQWIGAFVGFVVPAALGYAYASFMGYANPGMTALAAFLIAGLLRTVVVQQGTFCINSLCHMIGRRPYSTDHSARDSGVSILLVEQNARLALKVSSRAYVLESGHITLSGNSAELLQDDRVRAAYLGEAVAG